MSYRSRPKSGSALIAWNKFIEHTQQTPRDMSFGYSSVYGCRIWTAELGRIGEMWGFSLKWKTPVQLVSGRLENF